MYLIKGLGVFLVKNLDFRPFGNLACFEYMAPALCLLSVQNV
jgi:hypothetical protein